MGSSLGERVDVQIGIKERMGILGHPLEIQNKRVQELGILHAWASIIWLCGPLSGLLVQPLVGHFNDLYMRDDISKVDSHKFKTMIEEVDNLH